MTLYTILLSLFLTVWGVCETNALLEGPCFNFPGDSFVHFTPNNFINRDAIHYSLEFSTTEDNGLLMFTIGPDGDEEALYIRNGSLYYNLFNMAPSGVQGQFGGDYHINQRVNTGDWITVHVYRMWAMQDTRRQRRFSQTGILATINGRTYTSVDSLERNGINLSSTIFFGGYRENLGGSIVRFRGRMRNMVEHLNSEVFETPSLNYQSKVITPCV